MATVLILSPADAEVRVVRSSGGRLYSLSLSSAISSVWAQTREECGENPMTRFGPRGAAEVEGHIGSSLAIGACDIRTLGILRGVEDKACTEEGEGEPGSRL